MIRKVCHITNVHDNNDNRIFYKECSSLARAGYDVYLLAKGESREENGVHVIGLGDKYKGRKQRAIDFVNDLYQKALEVNADIYHLHDPELLRIALKLKKKGKLVIFDSHENYSAQILLKDYIPKELRKIISKLYYAYETHVVKNIDAVIFPCTINGKNIFEGRSKTTVFVGNEPRIEEFDDSISPDFSSNSVIYVGTLSWARGIKELVQGTYKAGMKLILAGEYPDKQFMKEIMSLPEYECVEFHGLIDHKDIPKLLSQAAIGACLLKNVGQYYSSDNLPTKVYEYMAAGVPCLLYDSDYIKETINEYPFGIYVNPESPEEIASALKRMNNDLNMKQNMSRIGKKASVDRFNWSFSENKLLSVYKSLEKGIK